MTGVGGSGSGNQNNGVLVNNSQIMATGTGSVTVTGTGGAGSGNFNNGVSVLFGGSITTADGDVDITGQGGGSGAAGNAVGVAIATNAAATTVSAGGSGNVTIMGTGGGGSGSDNSGVVLLGGAASVVTDTGSLSITGVAGEGTGQFGVSLRTNSSVTSTSGAILIDGNKSSGGLSGDVQLNGPVTTAGADITIQADRDILGDANGDVSTGAGGGTINLIANQDATGTPDDAGTLQIEGDLTAGTGGIGLNLTDTDGFLNGNIVSASTLSKLGTGTLQLNGTNTVNGIKTVQAGTLLVNGSITGAGPLGVDVGATLGGTGSIADLVLVDGTITGGTINDEGTLTVGGLSFNGGTYHADLLGNTSDTIAVTGTVDLQDSAQGIFDLNVQGTGGTAPGATYTFIDNQGAGAIVDPPLANAPEGGNVTVNGQSGIYTYVGGTGNDFTLTVAAGPTGSFTGTAADENFRLVRTATAIQLFSVSTITVAADGSINFTNPTLLQSFDANTTAFVIVDGGGGSDNLMIDYSGVAGLEDVDVAFTGGGTGTNSGLFVHDGTFGTVEYAYINATDGAIGNYTAPNALPSSLQSVILYEGLSPIVNNSNTVDVLFDLPNSGNVQAILEDDGTTGNTLSRLRSDPVAFEQTDFRNPTGSLVINAGSDTDDLLINALPDFDASLIVGVLAPLDQVTFAGEVTLAADQNLGVFANTIDFNGATSDVAISGNGEATLTTGQSIAMAAGSSLSTVDGDITLVATGTGAGSFVGIDIDGATVQATGTGNINATGIGGDAGAGGMQIGVQVASGGMILSDSGSVVVAGMGGSGSGADPLSGFESSGVRVDGAGSRIGSASGNVEVNGAGDGGGISLGNFGVNVSDGGAISTGGSGTINVTGIGGNGTGNGQTGVFIDGANSQIASENGTVTVTGFGGTDSGDFNNGVVVQSGGGIRSTGADVTVTGQGGGSGASGNAVGVAVATLGATTTISAGGSGSVTITGTGGGGAGSGNDGVTVTGAAASVSSDNDITINGTAGEGSGQFSVNLLANASVTATGSIEISGEKSSGGLSGDVQLNGEVTTDGGDVTIQADRDIFGNANGDISTGAGAGNITLTSDQDGMNSPNDAGTIHLAGDLTAGTGEVVLELTDTDGFLNGNIVSAGSVFKRGDGTLQMNGTANTYSGNTAVETGTLLVNGNITGTGSVVVSAPATLGGTGMIAGSVGVLGTITGGTITDVGTLTVSELLISGGTYHADLLGTTSDTIVVTGNVNLGTATGSAFDLGVQGGPTPAGTVFTFIDHQSAGPIFNPPLMNAPEGGTVPINARIGTYTYTGGDGNDFTLTVQESTDVQITKTGPASPVPGADVSYTLTVTNNGPDDAQFVGVADTLSTSTTFVSLTQDSGPTFNLFPPAVGSGGNVIMNISTLASGATATFTLVVNVDSSLTGMLSNTAQVATTSFDTDTSNNMSTATGTLLPQADLQITKTGPATILASQDLTYDITITNAGPSDALDIFAADALPTGTTFVSLTQNTGPMFTTNTPMMGNGGNVTLEASMLESGASATFTLVVNVGNMVNGTITNTAQITSLTTDDPDTTNNSSTVNTSSFIPDDLQIIKSGPALVDPGTDLTYTITVANTGMADAQTLFVADMIPTNTTFVSLTQTSGTAFDNINTPAMGGTGTVTMDTAIFAAGEVATFTLVVNVDSGFTSGTITNTAQVTSTTQDIDPSNNISTVMTDITEADVQIDKSGPTTVVAGENVAYTISFSNGGSDPATNFMIEDVLPAGTTFVSLTENAGGSGFTTSTPAVGSGGTVTITNPSLGVGVSGSFTLVVNVDSSVTGSIMNSATGTALTPDPDTNNNTGTVTTTVNTEADLQVTKTGPASVVPGNNETYILTVTNTGPSDALDVSISDALPTGTTFVSLTQTSGPSFNPTTPAVGSNGTVTLDATSLASGETATFELVVNVDSSVNSPDLTNTASGTTSTTDTNSANDTSSVTTLITPEADLEVTKTAPVTVIPGQTATFTIVVSNNGPSDALRSTITDNLPAELTGVTWTAAYAGGATGSASGSGSINEHVDLPSGGSVTYTVTGTVDMNASGTLSNTATAATLTGVTDPDLTNNSDTASSNIATLDPLTLIQQGGLATFTGNGNSNNLSIIETATPGRYIFRSNIPSTINGVAVQEMMLSNVSHIRVNTGVGAGDIVTLEGNATAGTTLTGNMEINGQGGVTLLDSNGSFNINGELLIIRDVNPGNLDITFDDLNNSFGRFVVTENSAGDATVNLTDQTIQQLSSVSLGNGVNTVNYTRTTAGNLIFNGSAGTDTVTLDATESNSNLTFSPGGGTNSITVQNGSNINGNSAIGTGSMRLSQVNLTDSTFGGFVALRADNNGTAEVLNAAISNATIGGQFTIIGGAGNDVINVSNSTVNGQTYIQTAAGNDSVRLENSDDSTPSNYNARVDVLLSSGNDFLSAALDADDNGMFAAFVNFNGGAGTDIAEGQADAVFQAGRSTGNFETST